MVVCITHKVLKAFSFNPRIKIVIPSSPYDAKGLLLSSIESNDPVLFFEHKKAYRFLKEKFQKITIQYL